MDDVRALFAVPPHMIYRVRRPRLLKHNPDGIRKSHRIVRGVGRQQVQRVLMDGHVDEAVRRARRVDRLEQHGALVLVEELGRLVDVVVGARVRPAHHHDGQAGRLGRRRVVHAVVVDRRLE